MKNNNTLYAIITIVAGLLCGYASSFFYTSPGKNKSTKPGAPAFTQNRRSPSYVKTVHYKDDRPKLSNNYSERNFKQLMARLKNASSSSDMEKELKELLKYPFGPLATYHQMAMMQLFLRWGEINPKEALKMALTLKGPWTSHLFLGDTPVLNALTAWAERDPQELAEYYSLNPESLRLYPKVLDKITFEFTKQSPERAWDWISTLNVTEQGNALLSFFSSLDQWHSSQLTDYINKLPPQSSWNSHPSAQDENLLLRLAQLWGKSDFDAAMKWATNLPKPWQHYPLKALLSEKAKVDLSSANQILLQLDPKAQPALVHSIWESIARSDNFDQAIKWVEEIKDSQYPAFVSTLYFADLLKGIDAATSKERIQTLSPGEVKDQLIIAHISSVYDTPAEKEKMARQISNEKKREETLLQLERYKNS